MSPSWRFASILAVLAVTVLETSAQGSEGRNRAPCFDLESELNYKGIKTDTASLIAIARSGTDVGTRWMAIEILGLKNEHRAKDALERLLDTSNDQLLKETAALALARLGAAKGIPALEKLMRASTSAERRIFVAARLAEFGNASGYRYVAEAAAGNDRHLQYLAVGDLVPFLRYETVLPGIDPTNRLVILLRHPDPQIRKEVLLHFLMGLPQGLSAARVRPLVERVARRDRDESVRERARLMLLSLPKQP